MTLPADSHVHSEWSWDATAVGSMVQTCARAVELGLPAVAFTEHADFTPASWPRSVLGAVEHLGALATREGTVTPPPLDVPGYLACIDRCRDQFRGLRIITGIELGEAHWHPVAVEELLRAGGFERVLGSMHCLPLDDESFAEPPTMFEQRPADEILRAYLAETSRMIRASDAFSVLAHIDYPVRYWPANAPAFEPQRFEGEFRDALRCLADSDRALEINTRLPLSAQILGWWCEEGGRAVTFGSDAHEPAALASDFADAAKMAEAYGFRASARPYDVWTRSR